MKVRTPRPGLTTIRGLNTAYSIFQEGAYCFQLYSAPGEAELKMKWRGRLKSKRAAIERINELEYEANQIPTNHKGMT